MPRSRKKGKVLYLQILPFFLILTVILSAFYVVFAVLFQKVNYYYVTKLAQKPLKRFNNPTSFEIPVLMYHYVEYVKDQKDTIRKLLDTLPPVLEKQITTLKENGYFFITPQDIEKIASGQSQLPKKAVIISFDDGYEDFYTNVLPILKRQKIRAVAYIISGFINKPNYMTKQELQEVIASKLVEMGCHTAHHPNLKYISQASALSEIRQCRDDIKQIFGINTVSFAYPYGSYNDTLFPLLRIEGFETAVTTRQGTQISPQNFYTIPRLRPGGRIGQELLTFLRREVYAGLPKDMGE